MREEAVGVVICTCAVSAVLDRLGRELTNTFLGWIVVIKSGPRRH